MMVITYLPTTWLLSNIFHEQYIVAENHDWFKSAHVTPTDPASSRATSARILKDGSFQGWRGSKSWEKSNEFCPDNFENLDLQWFISI